MLRSWDRDGVGARLEMLNLSDVGTEPGKGRGRHTASVLSPGLFAVLVSPGSDLLDLRVARCRWWNDTFVNGALAGAEEEILLEQFVPRLDALRMSGTSVTGVSIKTFWAAGVADIDVRGCTKVRGSLMLSPTWPVPRLSAHGGCAANGVAAGGKAAAEIAGVALRGGVKVARGPGVGGGAGRGCDVDAAGGWAVSQRPLPCTPRVASLALCGTRLTHLVVMGAPRVADNLTVNAAHCKVLKEADLTSTPLLSAGFPGSAKMVRLLMLDKLPAARPVALVELQELSRLSCSSVQVGCLYLTEAVAPNLSKLVLQGVLSLTKRQLDGLPLLADVNAAGCQRLSSVTVTGCPVLQRIDVPAKAAPLVQVCIVMPAQGNVLGVRGKWNVSWTEMQVLLNT